MEPLSEQLVEFYEKMSSWEMEIVKGTDLSLPQMHTVELIGTNGPIRMKDLAEKLGVVMGTLTVMIKRLISMDLVTRRVNTNDNRSYKVELTPKGHEIFEEHHQHHLLLAQEVCGDINEEELNSFSKTLSKVINNF